MLRLTRLLCSFKPKELTEVILDERMLIKLERSSGIRFRSDDEIKEVEEDIRMAQKIFDGVEPLYNITEEYMDCPLRSDIPEEQPGKMVMMNTSSTMDGFFVAPKTNIPLSRNKLFDEKVNVDEKA